MVQIRNAKEGLKHTFWFAYPFSRTLVLIPGLLYVLQVKNARTKIKLLMPHLNSIAQMAKYTIILQRAKEFSKLLDEIKKDWLIATEENRQIFSERASIEHKLTTVIVVTMYGGGFFYRTILPLSKGKILLPNNMTVRLLPCPSYFGSLNEQATPNYEIIFTLQVLGGFIIYTVLCGTKSACLMLCLHMCGLLKILTNKIVDLTNDSDEQIVQEKIVHIVEYQTRIKEREWEDSNAMAMVIYVVFQVTCVIGTFSVCYVGQLLLDESENIRQAYNTLNWYRLPVNKARSLILLILMSHYPIKVTAGRIMDLSLVTFTSIIKSAVGYMNMLRTVT
ncbi:Odorant receptor 33a [Apis cerana cerana]|uniref:Odorant receptor 33a n=1 Tax=Apis cerana cerana TaxID=94128 RepID=A0A2A3ETD2_APICC|nr:Odorant receptor 33a [Apis cerana cerana]